MRHPVCAALSPTISVARSRLSIYALCRLPLHVLATQIDTAQRTRCSWRESGLSRSAIEAREAAPAVHCAIAHYRHETPPLVLLRALRASPFYNQAPVSHGMKRGMQAVVFRRVVHEAAWPLSKVMAAITLV